MASSGFLTCRQVLLLTIVVVLATSVSANTRPPRICQADIAILVDCSGSIKQAGEENWGILLEFVNRIVKGVGVSPFGNRIAEIYFSNNAYVHFDFNRCNDYDCVERLVNNTPYSDQRTNTSGAFRTAVRDLFNPNAGDRRNVTDIIILITDGKPNPVDPSLETYVRDTVRRDLGIRVYGVGITQAVNTTLMKQLVSPPSSETYFNVTQFSQLQTVLERLIEQTCVDPDVTTPAPTPAPTTTTPAPTPAPTTARQISPGCTTRFDVVFVLDSSGSIGEVNFNLMKGFVTNLINEFPVDEGNVRVGLETFSTNFQTEFNLNRYTRRSDIASHLNRLVYRQGTTNTAAALRNVYEQMFTSGAGDRSNVVNIIVVMTDGGSNNREDTISRANMAKSRGIHIVVVGIGKWTEKSELRAMASYPYSSNLVEVDSFQGLSSIRSALRTLICNGDNGCAANPCIRGSCVNEIGSYRCICPNNFVGERCDQQCRNGADIVFAIDKSGSIGKEDFQLQIDFVRNFFARLNLASLHKVGLASFSNEATTSFQLREFSQKAELLGATNVYYTGGSTNTARVLQLIRNEMLSSINGRRSNVPAVAVILTDGRSNDPSATWREARELRKSGTHVIAVGVGNNVRPMELQGIASSPNDVYRVANFGRLNSITTELMNAVCNNNNECSNNNPCQNGGVCTDTINGYTCRCQQGFSGPDCSRRCSGQVDIGFIVDASGSIRNERWPFVKDFITNITSAFRVSDSQTHIGALTWSNSATLQFNLNTYTTTYDVNQAIHRMNFVGGRTHTAEALRMGTNQLFNESNGARSGIKIAIVFTDGGSNINEARTIPEAIRLRVSGVHVIVIALGDDVNQLELRGIASEPYSANLFFAESYNDLPGLVARVQSATCDVNNDCSSDPCLNNGVCADGLGRYVCQCSRPFTGLRCERQCNRQMDIAFIIDLSGSVDVVYEIMITFTKLVVSGLPVGTDTQVALVSFSDQAEINFDLNDFSTVEGVRTAIAFQRAGGRTNAQAALRLVNTDVFTAARGDRNNIANKAVIVTDGGSNINRGNTLPEAQNLKNSGVELFAVAVGNMFDMDEINGIASDVDSEHVIRLPNSGEVNRAANQLLNWLCNR